MDGYSAGMAHLSLLMAPAAEPARSLFLNKAMAVAMGRLHGTMGPGPQEPAAPPVCRTCGGRRTIGETRPVHEEPEIGRSPSPFIRYAVEPCPACCR